MGNRLGASGMKASERDKAAIWSYLEQDSGKESPPSRDHLTKLWKAFDKDGSGEIDQEELQEIVFHLIALFWEKATPSKKQKVPKRDQLQSVIDHICEDIMKKVGKGNKDVITRAEFDKFGEYLLEQWRACQAKLEKDGNPNGQGAIALSTSLRGIGRGAIRKLSTKNTD